MVRLIVYNIEYCSGLTGRLWDYLKFWRMLKSRPKLAYDMIQYLKGNNPDILALVEVDSGTFRTDYTDEGIIFEKYLHLKDIEEVPQYSFSFSKSRFLRNIPYLCRQSNAFISKYSLKDIRHHFLSRGRHNVVIQVSVDCPKRVTLLLSHLSLKKRHRASQIKELSGIVNRIKGPVILMGDFNTFNGSHELDYLISNSHLRDIVSMDDDSLTYPAFRPKKRLDYILVSEDISVDKFSVLNAKFSDHLPIMVDFSVKKKK